MTLIDTGPLVALVDKSDLAHHQKCVAVFRTLKRPPLTTWPCLTEALYLLDQFCGWKGQRVLLEFFSRGAIQVHAPSENELERISELMEKYQDRPMDFADAALVALAESQGLKRDSDFYIYQIHDRAAFDVLSLDFA